MALLALAVVAGCGGGDSSDAAPTVPPSSAAPYDALTATPAERLEHFRMLLARRGIPSETNDGEAATVAANVCDNDVAGMGDLLAFAEVIDGSEAGMTRFASEKVTLIDAYCPTQRLQFEAALADHPGVSIPQASE